MIIKMKLGTAGYDINIERGCFNHADSLLNLKRNVLIVTDDGVPAEYSKKIASMCSLPVIVTVKQGEGSKSFASLEMLCRTMMQHDFNRHDCVVAVGGGVVGDLAGFAAASYMRGIDFYNIPTTLLSQVDSSIGGKVAVNLDHIKNIVGAFWQPKAVIIDPDVLRTLPARQISNGLAEALKMGMTSDESLFNLFETGDIDQNIERIIVKSLIIKKNVVEQDERENGLRRILNFGHTIGHGIESVKSDELYHGECVALGMIPMCSEKLRPRLIRALNNAGLPTECVYDREAVISALSHDKKSAGDSISVIYVPEIGAYEIRSMNVGQIGELV